MVGSRRRNGSSTGSHEPVGKALRDNIRYMCIVGLMSMVILESGFDSGAISGFQSMVGFLKLFGYKDPTSSTGWNIATTPQQLISSLMTLGSAVGAFMVGPISSYLPRLWSIAVGCVLLMVAVAIQAATTSLSGLYAGRLIVGFGNGLVQTLCVIYVQETAPAHLRSLSAGILQSFSCVGSLIGSVVNNGTQSIESRLCYQIPLFVLLGLPCILLLNLPFIPESPRWLLLKGKEEAAFKALRALRRGACDETEVEEELSAMKAWSLHEIETAGSTNIADLFRGCNLRRTLLSWGVATSPSGIGSMFILQYGVYFFQAAGVGKSFEDTVIVQCLGLAGIYTSFLVIRRAGTKRMLELSAALCSLCMLLMAILYTASPKSNAGTVGVVVLTAVYMFGFNIGIAVYSYPVAAEIPSQRLRAYTTGTGVGISFFFSWLITFTAPYFINTADLSWGPKYGYVWFGSSALVFLFLFFFVPDLSGRELEEVDALFEAKVPARLFRSHVVSEGQVMVKAMKHDLEEVPEVVHQETT